MLYKDKPFFNLFFKKSVEHREVLQKIPSVCFHSYTITQRTINVCSMKTTDIGAQLRWIHLESILENKETGEFVEKGVQLKVCKYAYKCIIYQKKWLFNLSINIFKFLELVYDAIYTS